VLPIPLLTIAAFVDADPSKSIEKITAVDFLRRFITYPPADIDCLLYTKRSAIEFQAPTMPLNISLFIQTLTLVFRNATHENVKLFDKIINLFLIGVL
jgi:hypothetical protein